MIGASSSISRVSDVESGSFFSTVSSGKKKKMTSISMFVDSKHHRSGRARPIIEWGLTPGPALSKWT
ncbi:hypothetical protein Pyn_23913 [Prunus yedoensis var. nudiflora]|uniref:Uncharacterized protein n=1 Tax=Prunus yedoensis var. nudiflora TaxID=2094558 RepID=A0A314YFK3_PRUYE|nr:hypothetical protein Pyn_23913 [Prunus yedoensis var. nudiflora]